MAFLKWADELSVGVSVIDEQHKKLIVMLNEFYDNLNNGSNEDNLKRLVKSMLDYSEVHFKTEEAYFAKYNYSGAKEHIQAHEAFRARAGDITAKMNAGKQVISMEITGFLKGWLTNHIQIEDKKYIECFNKQGLK